MPTADEETTPRPDPTIRTLDASRREVEHLRELVDAKFAEIMAILAERTRGVELAEREREKASGTAEQEREKAAQALRGELERRIDTGDAALREHVTQQIAQVREALTSSERLELARIEHLSELVDNLRREGEMNHSSAEQAIAKSESANDRRFESVNEFRAQLADQTATFMPREVAEAQFADLRRSIAEITEKMSKVV